MVAPHSIMLQPQLGNLPLHQAPAGYLQRLLTSIAKQVKLEGIKPLRLTGNSVSSPPVLDR